MIVDAIKAALVAAYKKNYNNCAYIVIYAKDEKNNIKTARVKINIVPHLFDLTDATIDYPYQGVTDKSVTLDITDKYKFNI